MAESVIDLTDELCVEPQSHPEFADFPQTLVSEKIIFCIDILLLTKEFENEKLISTIFYCLKSYFNLKKKISVKPSEFECLLVINNEKIIHSNINSTKDIQAAVSLIKTIDCDEDNEPVELENLFNKIAEIIELPDPKYKNSVPPPWVYHVVWLFGRNLFLPTLKNTNSFDFLMMTPYVALDILYVYDENLENNRCEEISQVLMRLNENGKGYYLAASVTSKNKILSCFYQMLGHPLIRKSQEKAKFNIKELGQSLEHISSSDDEL